MWWGAIPRSVWDFREKFISSGGCRGVGVAWFMFATICWTLWLNRDDFVLNNKLVSSPRALIFRLISLLQHWMATSVGMDRTTLERAVVEIKTQVSEEMVASGVG
jgi:hypothetical protein